MVNFRTVGSGANGAIAKIYIEFTSLFFGMSNAQYSLITNKDLAIFKASSKQWDLRRLLFKFFRLDDWQVCN